MDSFNKTFKLVFRNRVILLFNHNYNFLLILLGLVWFAQQYIPLTCNHTPQSKDHL